MDVLPIHKEFKRQLEVVASQLNPKTGKPYNVIRWAHNKARRDPVGERKHTKRISNFWRGELRKMFSKWGQ